MKKSEHQDLIEQSRRFLSDKLDDPELLRELEMISQETGRSIDALKRRLTGTN